MILWQQHWSKLQYRREKISFVIFDSMKSVSLSKSYKFYEAKKTFSRHLAHTVCARWGCDSLQPHTRTRHFVQPILLPALRSASKPPAHLRRWQSDFKKPPKITFSTSLLPSKFVSSSFCQSNTFFQKNTLYCGESVAYVTIALAEGRGCQPPSTINSERESNSAPMSSYVNTSFNNKDENNNTNNSNSFFPELYLFSIFPAEVRLEISTNK